MSEIFDPPHPGRILTSALDALKLSTEQFASNLGLSSESIAQVISGEAPLTLRCGSVCKRRTIIGKGSNAIRRIIRKPRILLEKSFSSLDISVCDFTKNRIGLDDSTQVVRPKFFAVSRLDQFLFFLESINNGTGSMRVGHQHRINQLMSFLGCHQAHLNNCFPDILTGLFAVMGNREQLQRPCSERSKNWLPERIFLCWLSFRQRRTHEGSQARC